MIKSKIDKNVRQPRRASLDGLRGLAALVVVVHHELLTLPWFANRVTFGLLGPRKHFTGSIHNLFEYTPLHVFYGGTEAVVIFFVLSGYVLVNPINRRFIHSYVQNRLVRLYPPILVAVTLAGLLVLAFPRKKLVGGSWWINFHAIRFTFSSYLRNLVVVDGNDWLDSSLWSMKYEIIFSLAIMVFAGYLFRSSFLKFELAILVIIALVWMGVQYNLDLLGWLPVFFAGTALHWLPEGKLKMSSWRFFFGIVVLFMPWCFAGFGLLGSPALDRILMMLGAVLIVEVCRESNNSISRLLTRKTSLLAGKYSYSLYLIHVPILTTVWFVMGQPTGHVAWVVRFVISLICIALGTAVVYHLGEKPSLKWLHNR